MSMRCPCDLKLVLICDDVTPDINPTRSDVHCCASQSHTGVVQPFWCASICQHDCIHPGFSQGQVILTSITNGSESHRCPPRVKMSRNGNRPLSIDSISKETSLLHDINRHLVSHLTMRFLMGCASPPGACDCQMPHLRSCWRS